MSVKHSSNVLAGNRLQKSVAPFFKRVTVYPLRGLRRNVHENKFQELFRTQLGLKIVNLV